jgi:signal transduction histidine kinase
MRLKVKFAIYNALSKAIIIGAFGIVLPQIIQTVVYNHIDNRLRANAERAIKMVSSGGLDEIKHEQDCSYADHSIFKEEFIKIEPITDAKAFSTNDSIVIESWELDGEELQHRVLRRSFMYDNQLYSLNIGEGLSTIQQLDKSLTSFTVWLMLIVVLLSIASDFAFIGMLLIPFNKILDKLRAVGDPLKFESNPVKSSTYEFEYMDKTFENLMQKIKADFNNEKEFIANVSHELQTPISILQNRFENIISDGKTDHETAIKIVESQKTLNRLSRVIKALLMISKIENEQYIKTETASFNEIISEIIEETDDRCSHKEVTIHNNLENEIVIENCNTSLIHIMLSNLIGNAIKYNKNGGTITISGCRTNNHFELIIADTGMGIEPDKLALIFDRFVRFHANDGNSFGLGLPIVKTIANFHHIELMVTSEVNIGTTFTLKGAC